MQIFYNFTMVGYSGLDILGKITQFTQITLSKITQFCLLMLLKTKNMNLLLQLVDIMEFT